MIASRGWIRSRSLLMMEPFLIPSWPDHSAVASPRRAPAIVERRAVRVREPGGDFLVDVDPQPRRLVGAEIAVLDLRAAREDLAGLGAECSVFVDAKVVTGELQVQTRSVPDGRDITRPVPGGLDTEELAERRHL